MKQHIREIQSQFSRQAASYIAMDVTSNASAHEAMVRRCAVDSSDHVLDVACGPGFLTHAFAMAAAHVIGFDATDRFIEHAREMASASGLGNVEFVPGDANELPWSADSFDVACCRAAFHHFPEPGRVLSEMTRVTKPGGRIVVADFVSSENIDKAAFHDHVERLCDPTHQRALRVSELYSLFEKSGLEVVDTASGSMTYDLDGWLDHGGPSTTNRFVVRQLMSEAIGSDHTDLDVDIVEGKIHFSHKTLLLIGQKPGFAAEK